MSESEQTILDGIVMDQQRGKAKKTAKLKNLRGYNLGEGKLCI